MDSLPPPLKQLLPTERQSLWKFRRALRAEDQAVLDALLEAAQKHALAATHAGHGEPFELQLLVMLLEQQKEINRLRERLAQG